MARGGAVRPRAVAAPAAESRATARVAPFVLARGGSRASPWEPCVPAITSRRPPARNPPPTRSA